MVEVSRVGEGVTTALLCAGVREDGRVEEAV